MDKSMIGAVTLACVSFWVVMTAGTAAVWLTGEVRVMLLVALPAAVVAAMLIVYFDWRLRVQQRMVVDRDTHPA